MLALSGLDGAFLHLETPQTPMHVASLSLFELPPGFRGRFHTAVKQQLARRLHRVPVLTRKLATMPLQFANPVWVHDDRVDLDHHVQRLTLPRPGTLAQLEDCVGELHARLLDRDRPLWQLWVIDGLQSGLVAYYLKAHHAVLDGMAGVQLAQALFDASAKPPPSRRGSQRPEEPAEHPGLVALAAAALKHDAAQYVKLVRHLPEVLKTLAGLLGAPTGSDAQAAPARSRNFGFGPHTPINVPITADRGFAGLSLPLDALKALAKDHEATLNDIVLALASGTLRRYLAQHGGIPRKPLIAAMPVSLRAAGNTDYTTQATMTLVNLHTHVADPIRRLRAIRDAAAAAKALTRQARSILPTDFPSIATPWLVHGLATLYGHSGLAGAIPPIANVVVSNVPGPPLPLYSAGARMVSYLPVSIPEHGMGLNLTVMSYSGALGFGFVTARNAVPDARQLTRALQAAFEELVDRSMPQARAVAARAPVRRTAARRAHASA
jgi:diacylglycerol O-acyltransferase / wax synthase